MKNLLRKCNGESWPERMGQVLTTANLDQARRIQAFLESRNAAARIIFYRGVAAFEYDADHPDVREALKMIYEFRTAGWHTLKHIYMREGVCTKEEFSEALRAQTEAA